MTIMNWMLTADRAVIVSDTLVTGLGNRRDHFGTKVRLLPHLGIMLGCSGAILPLNHMWAMLTHKLAVFSVEDVVDLAPALLQAGYDEARRNGLEEEECAPIMFGWSHRRQRLLGYLFRRHAGFQPHELGDGILFHPALQDHSLLSAWQGTSTDWWEAALQQQDHARQEDAGERNHIGGWLTMHTLQASPDGRGAWCQCGPLGVLPHFDEDVGAVLERAREQAKAA